MSSNDVHVSRRTMLAGGAAMTVAAALPGTAAAATLAETFGKPKAGSTATVDHSAWDSLVKAYVKINPDGVNRVAYGAFKREAADKLKAYVAMLEQTDVTALDRSEQFAFWANLYNSKTIDVILDHYPVKSIREISINEGILGFLKKSTGLGGPWKAQLIKLRGTPMSLDNVEHDVMRVVFKDPRVHYSVNCASFGCPNLPNEAFTGAKLEAMLDAGAKAFVNHPRGFKVDAGRVRASSIYEWFQADFGGSQAGVLAHARKYAGPDLTKALDGVTSIASFDYDWALNNAA